MKGGRCGLQMAGPDNGAGPRGRGRADGTAACGDGASKRWRGCTSLGGVFLLGSCPPARIRACCLPHSVHSAPAPTTPTPPCPAPSSHPNPRPAPPAADGGGVPAAPRGPVLPRAAGLCEPVHAQGPLAAANRGAAAAAPVCHAARVGQGAGRGRAGADRAGAACSALPTCRSLTSEQPVLALAVGTACIAFYEVAHTFVTSGAAPPPPLPPAGAPPPTCAPSCGAACTTPRRSWRTRWRCSPRACTTTCRTTGATPTPSPPTTHQTRWVAAS